MISRQLIRRFTTTAARRSADDAHGGVPGGNMPFDINNRYKLTLYFALFFGSSVGFPFMAVRHQMLKK